MPAVTSMIIAGMSVAGAAMSAAGAIGGTSAAHDAASAQQSQIQDEQKAEGIRHQAEELTARRQQMEVVRNQQRARSMALSAASNQGAQFGSGLQGGYGQVSGASGVNMLGIQQNLDLGNQMFGVNAQLSQDRIAMSKAQSSAATWAGVSSLGGSLMKAAPMASNLMGGFSFGSAGGGGGYTPNYQGTGDIYGPGF